MGPTGDRGDERGELDKGDLGVVAVFKQGLLVGQSLLNGGEESDGYGMLPLKVCSGESSPSFSEGTCAKPRSRKRLFH